MRTRREKFSLQKAEKSKKCSICLGPLKALGILQCGHAFCFTCIQTWSERDNRCPLCKERFHEILDVFGCKFPVTYADFKTTVLDSGCKVCRSKANEEVTLLCDRCEDPYHIYCLNPPLEKVPEGEWICPMCVARSKVPADTNLDFATSIFPNLPSRPPPKTSKAETHQEVIATKRPIRNEDIPTNSSQKASAQSAGIQISPVSPTAHTSTAFTGIHTSTKFTESHTSTTSTRAHNSTASSGAHTSFTYTTPHTSTSTNGARTSSVSTESHTHTTLSKFTQPLREKLIATESHQLSTPRQISRTRKKNEHKVSQDHPAKSTSFRNKSKSSSTSHKRTRQVEDDDLSIIAKSKICFSSYIGTIPQFTGFKRRKKWKNDEAVKKKFKCVFACHNRRCGKVGPLGDDMIRLAKDMELCASIGQKKKNWNSDWAVCKDHYRIVTGRLKKVGDSSYKTGLVSGKFCQVNAKGRSWDVKILAETKSRILVHYEGSTSSHDEWLSKSSIITSTLSSGVSSISRTKLLRFSQFQPLWKQGIGVTGH